MGHGPRKNSLHFGTAPDIKFYYFLLCYFSQSPGNKALILFKKRIRDSWRAFICECAQFSADPKKQSDLADTNMLSWGGGGVIFLWLCCTVTESARNLQLTPVCKQVNRDSARY